MKPIKTALLFLFIASGVIAQLPYQESFESTTGYTADVDIIDNLSDYFARMNTPCTGMPCEVNFSAGYTGYDGTFYWAGEDHDDSGILGGSMKTLCITLDPIDISANTTGLLNISIAAAANNISNAYDAGTMDGIYVAYQIDAGAFLPVHTWGYYTPDMGVNEYLSYDEDNDGVISATESDTLTGAFRTKNRMVAAIGSSLVIRICAHSDASSEEWAVDNIQVSSATTTPLPVEMTDFSVRQNQNKVSLVWKTITELENKGFEVQRSLNAFDWDAIGFVAGNGTSQETHTYQFEDRPDIYDETIYYRLKQHDSNGTYSFSQIVSATMNSIPQLMEYPNPFSEVLNISVQNDISLQIRNQFGQEVLRRQITKEATLDLGHFPPGIYFLSYNYNGHLITRKLVKN
ncbi:MAG: T9SS type A sorting domain-containing protein [Bacteroidota bacterium]